MKEAEVFTPMDEQEEKAVEGEKGEDESIFTIQEITIEELPIDGICGVY